MFQSAKGAARAGIFTPSAKEFAMFKSTPHTDEYARMLNVLERSVAALNDVLGYGNDNATKVSVGYLGNDNDTIWYVFLPHPNRYGRDEDRIGGWNTNNVQGVRNALSQVRAMTLMAKHIDEFRAYTTIR